MRDIKGRVAKLTLTLNYSKGLRPCSQLAVMPRRHTREAPALRPATGPRRQLLILHGHP